MRFPQPAIGQRSRLALVVTAGLLALLVRTSDGRPGCEVSCGRSPEQTCLLRGVHWLCHQQAPDGGWHSTTYGQLRDGVGNTALVLAALSRAPVVIRQRYAVFIRRGLEFLLGNPGRKDSLPALAASADYPTYAAALTLTAIHRLQIRNRTEEQRLLRKYLQATQLRDQQGYFPHDPDYGGWDHTGGRKLVHRSAAETDIAVTCTVLEALKVGGTLEPAVRQGALLFVSRCQNISGSGTGDGGFFFTPVPEDLRNKAGLTPVGRAAFAARSYGTATADGLRALRACGILSSDPRVRQAVVWLLQQECTDVVPGFTDREAMMSGPHWHEGLAFYYGASLSEVLDLFPSQIQAKRRSALLRFLCQSQEADGAWRNSISAMREDDPLIATALAIITLSTLSR